MDIAMRKLLLISGLIGLSSLASANTTSNHLNESSAFLNDKDLITIQPHTRSAEVNARHAAECAAKGGTDVTDEVLINSGNKTSNILLCRINNDQSYKQLPKSLTGISARSEAASGFYDQLTYSASSKAIFSVIDPDPNVVHLAMGMGVFEAGGSAKSCGMPNNCGACIDFMTVVPSGTYTLDMTCNTVAGGRIPSIAWAEEHYRDGKNVRLSSDSNVIIHPDNNIMVSPKKNIGYSDNVPMCNNPSSSAGNPINIAIGNKFQVEQDISDSGVYPLNFVRYYNSSAPLYNIYVNAFMFPVWNSSYSSKLVDMNTEMITLSMDSGQEIRFYNERGVIRPSPTNLGTLVKSGNNYIYTSPWNEVSEFNSDGKLIRTVNSTGLVHTISYAGNVVTAKDTFGHVLTITNNDKGQPVSVVSSDGQKVNYEYDGSNRLVKVTKNGKTKQYLYENATYTSALTGIKDERGIRYVTWGYDDKGRANLSEHAGGKDKVSITYVSDSQTKFTNPLNRSYTYNYKVIDGVKRITSIQGAASSQCPAIGSSYEYNARGLVTLATDGKGIKTSYEYNDKGQEISKTVGVGTAESLTIKTTWDDRFFNKPKTVTYPDKVITYSYDAKGNLLNQTVQTK